MPRYRIGIDIGGTFTDFAVHDTDTHALTGLKVPTVPARPVEGIVAGLKVLVDEHGVALDQVDYFVHGTTIAVNALIERKGARLGLLVTRGIPRHPDHPAAAHSAAAVLVRQSSRAAHSPRAHLRNRRAHAGRRQRGNAAVRGEPRGGARAGAPHGVEGLVVCFLHAFRNPAHEKAARAFLERAAPELFVCCSHEVWPQMREYERAIITIVNAYVMPPVARYLTDLQSRLAEMGVPVTPYITRSNGGVMTARRARASTAETLLSGPASGVIGAMRVAQQAGMTNLITLDVGGTSADVAIVEEGAPRTSLSEHVGRLPDHDAGDRRVLDRRRRRVDRLAGQRRRIEGRPAKRGRRSRPRLLWQGRQRLPTVTDAFLYCGFLNPDTFAGGRIALHPALAEKALATLAPGLGTDAGGVADGIIADHRCRDVRGTLEPRRQARHRSARVHAGRLWRCRRAARLPAGERNWHCAGADPAGAWNAVCAGRALGGRGQRLCAQRLPAHGQRSVDGRRGVLRTRALAGDGSGPRRRSSRNISSSLRPTCAMSGSRSRSTCRWRSAGSSAVTGRR